MRLLDLTISKEVVIRTISYALSFYFIYGFSTLSIFIFLQSFLFKASNSSNNFINMATNTACFVLFSIPPIWIPHLVFTLVKLSRVPRWAPKCSYRAFTKMNLTAFSTLHVLPPLILRCVPSGLFPSRLLDYVGQVVCTYKVLRW